MLHCPVIQSDFLNRKRHRDRDVWLLPRDCLRVEGKHTHTHTQMSHYNIMCALEERGTVMWIIHMSPLSYLGRMLVEAHPRETFHLRILHKTYSFTWEQSSTSSRPERQCVQGRLTVPARCRARSRTSLVSGSPTGHSEASRQVTQAWALPIFHLTHLVPCTVTTVALPCAP